MTRELRNMMREKIQVLQSSLKTEHEGVIVVDGVQFSVKRIEQMISKASKIAFDQVDDKYDLYFIPLSLIMKEESWRELQRKLLEELEPKLFSQKETER